MNPFERLEELTDTKITMEQLAGFWTVYIRPDGGGYPLVRGYAETLSEAVKQAVELWETK